MSVRRSLSIALVSLFFITSASAGYAQVSVSRLGDEVTSDFKYIANNTLMDSIDAARAPLHATSPDSPIFSPKFYLVLAGAGAL